MQRPDTFFGKLRHAFFQEEIETIDEFKEKLKGLSQELEAVKAGQDPEKQHALMEAHFEEKISYLQEHFPELFGTFVTQAIKVQISESKDEVIEALYPIMGKLISKYIRTEIEALSQRIEQQLDQSFSLKNLGLRLKAFFSGVKYEDIILRNSSEGTLEEVLMVEQGSGLLLGKYSQTQLMDADMIAGMFTAIKSFVQDAFRKEGQELETLSYDDYIIAVYNLPSYYFAFVFSGQLFAKTKAKLQEHVLTFMDENTLPVPENGVTNEVFEQYSSALTEHFYEFNKMGE